MSTYAWLHDLATRPAPFSRYTAKTLWTRPHLARQMLAYHLDQATDLASRREETIAGIVNFLDDRLGLQGKTLCDLGCGPGLYTEAFNTIGATTTGVDFSRHSLDHATEHTDPAISYLEADYLADELPAGFDIVTLIYTDFCVLSPEQRRHLMAKVRRMLNPGGHFVFDVLNTKALAAREETIEIEDRMMNGFWAEGDYVGIRRSWRYPDHDLALDRFLVVEPGETWEVYNWFQHYTPETLSAELTESGFTMSSLFADLAGRPLTESSDLMGVIATPA